MIGCVVSLPDDMLEELAEVHNADEDRVPNEEFWKGYISSVLDESSKKSILDTILNSLREEKDRPYAD